MHDKTVVLWLALSPHCKKFVGSIPAWGCVEFQCFSRFSDFYPKSKNKHVMQIGNSKLWTAELSEVSPFLNPIGPMKPHNPDCRRKRFDGWMLILMS